MRQVANGLLFILPNLLGVLVFTLLPVIFSGVMAFTNWNLTKQNQFLDGAIRWVGVQHFLEMLSSPHFYQYLGNTLYLLLAVPPAIAASLGAALLLQGKLDLGGKSRLWLPWVAGFATLVCAAGCFSLGATSAGILFAAGGVIFGAGAVFGHTAYRTLFYIPHFTSGVATFLLWKKLFDPTLGPVNQMLAQPLQLVGGVLSHVPQWAIWMVGLSGLLGALAMLLMATRDLHRRWRDGEIDGALALGGIWIAVVPPGIVAGLMGAVEVAMILAGLAFIVTLGGLTQLGRRPERLPSNGNGLAVWKMIFVGAGAGVLIAMAGGLLRLTGDSALIFSPPDWLGDPAWAKNAFIIIMIWAAAGSNHMLLYLAALGNVSGELREASQIDGASYWAEFVHVTWPQIFPTTFFIFVTSLIGGLQGGFEIARTLTEGGPAGATTTLSYHIYQEGFEAGRLGYASAVSWVMFVLILMATLLTWRFGKEGAPE